MQSLWNTLNIVIVLLQCLVPAAGIVVTAMGRRTHGRAAMLGLFGCVALLLEGLLRLGQTIFLETLVRSVGIGGVSRVLGILGLVSFVLTVTGLGLLIWAVVARRTPPPQPAAPGWPQPHPGPQQGWPQTQPAAQPGPYQNPQPGPYQNPQQTPYQEPQPGRHPGQPQNPPAGPPPPA
ncbi:hypothetical protein [Nonomuraea sp. NPDC048826]|uniref:hypothetical protein n=1 Tax=Nonomuraea sp. NPDC048826 TaxID=3364347 RepID=UPI00371A81A0